MAKGLAALQKWKKCQRRVANAVLRAAKAGKAPPAKKAMLRAAANSLASLACSKGAKGRKGRMSRAGRGARSSRRFSKRDFNREQEMELRALRSQAHAEPLFNPETSY